MTEEELESALYTQQTIGTNLTSTPIASNSEQEQVHMIGDSNASRIYEKLTMTHHKKKFTQTYTLEKMEEWSRTTNRESHTIYALNAATNNIRRGKTAQWCADMIDKVTTNLKTKNMDFVIVQIPPLDVKVNGDRGFAARQATKFNTLLEVNYPDQVITTESIENNPHAIIEDGVHLSIESSKTMADLLQQRIENYESEMTATEHTDHYNRESQPRSVEENQGLMQVTEQQPTNQQPHHNPPQQSQPSRISEEVTTTHAHAAVVIGRAGTRIRNIKTQHQVQIESLNTPGDQTTFVIRGSARNVNLAKDEIEKIIANTNIDSTRIKPIMKEKNKGPKINVLCRQYLAGDCPYRNDCKFLHQQGPADISIRSQAENSSMENPRADSTRSDSSNRNKRRLDRSTSPTN